MLVKETGGRVLQSFIIDECAQLVNSVEHRDVEPFLLLRRGLFYSREITTLDRREKGCLERGGERENGIPDVYRYYGNWSYSFRASWWSYTFFLLLLLTLAKGQNHHRDSKWVCFIH